MIIQLTMATGSGKSCFKVCHCRDVVQMADFVERTIWSAGYTRQATTINPLLLCFFMTEIENGSRSVA